MRPEDFSFSAKGSFSMTFRCAVTIENTTRLGTTHSLLCFSSYSVLVMSLVQGTPPSRRVGWRSKPQLSRSKEQCCVLLVRGQDTTMIQRVIGMHRYAFVGDLDSVW